MPQYVHVYGPPGAGKTTLGERLGRLPGARHVELDDVHWAVLSEHPDVPRDFERRKRQRLDALLRDGPAADAVVLSGLTVDLTGLEPMLSLWLKIDDLEAAYRRLLLRELRKAKDRAPRAEAAVRTEPVATLHTAVMAAAELIAPLGGMSFADYRHEYEGYLRHARREGHRLVTQEEAIERATAAIAAARAGHAPEAPAKRRPARAASRAARRRQPRRASRAPSRPTKPARRSRPRRAPTKPARAWRSPRR